MKKLLILFLLFSVNTFAQKVPSKIEFAGIKLHLSDKLRDELQKEVDMLTVSPKYFQIKVDRAKIYFPIIENIFAEEGVPDDFKYLVLQESALIADAVSVSDAVGYWQFKDFTAMEMGLRVDRHVDERMNIVSSTYGAAQYLKKNNTFFDNWLYALQAYQMGAGGALKVVDKKYYGAKSMELDHNTYWYVKKYLAHKISFESALEGESPKVLNLYTKGSNKTLEEIAEETSVDIEELQAYNVWLKTKRIPDDKTYSVVLPVNYTVAGPIKVKLDKAEPSVIPQKVIIAEQNHYPVFDTRKRLFTGEEIKTINGIPGMVATDEKTLIDLALRADMSLGKFMKYNDLNVKDKPIKGQVYYLKRKKAKAPTYYHIVNYGENLWQISQRYGVRMNKLILKNRLTSERDIKPGLVLWLRHVRPESVPVEYKELPTPKEEKLDSQDKPAITKKTVETAPKIKEAKEEVVVSENDNVTSEAAEESQISEPVTLAEEAQGLRVVEDEKEKASTYEVVYESDNPTEVAGENNDNIQSEEVTDTDNEVKEQQGDEFINHTIAAGETLYSLSKKYQVQVVDILDWNHLKINDKLSVGQELKILQQKEVEDHSELVNLQTDAAQHQFHQVKEGETLYQIARKYQVTIQEIMEWNGKSDYSISVGDKLIVKK